MRSTPVRRLRRRGAAWAKWRRSKLGGMGDVDVASRAGFVEAVAAVKTTWRGRPAPAQLPEAFRANVKFESSSMQSRQGAASFANDGNSRIIGVI